MSQHGSVSHRPSALPKSARDAFCGVQSSRRIRGRTRQQSQQIFSKRRWTHGRFCGRKRPPAVRRDNIRALHRSMSTHVASRSRSPQGRCASQAPTAHSKWMGQQIIATTTARLWFSAPCRFPGSTFNASGAIFYLVGDCAIRRRLSTPRHAALHRARRDFATLARL